MSKDHNTYYLTDDVVMYAFEMATNINDDVDWLAANEANQVVGAFMNGKPWVLSRDILNTGTCMPAAMNMLCELSTDSHLYKVIQMQRLINALPEPKDKGV